MHVTGSVGNAGKYRAVEDEGSISHAVSWPTPPGQSTWKPLEAQPDARHANEQDGSTEAYQATAAIAQKLAI